MWQSQKMKKALSFILCMLILSGMIAASGAFTASAYTGNKIYSFTVDRTQTKMCVSSGASYKIAYSGTAAHATYKDDGKKLTDGATSKTLATSYSGSTGVGLVTITIDLGGVKNGLADFELHTIVDSSAGAVMVSNFKLEVSDDGNTFVNVKYGQGAIPASTSNSTAYTLKYSLTDGVAARYVRYTLATEGTFLFDEAAVYTYGIVKSVSADGSNYKDDQGLIYTANTTAGTAYVSSYTNSYTTTTTVQGSGYAASSATGKSNNTTYTIGKGATEFPNGVKVTADFISSSRSNRPGIINNNKKYVVVHNTGNYASGATAKSNHNYQTTNAACTSASWHYTVGKDGIYQALPDNENAWHASDGSYGTGNYYGIGMEVCVNGFTSFSGSAWTNFLNDTFYENCRRAALLTVELCKRHGLNPGNCTLGTAIRQHYDSNQKNCPQQMRYNTSAGSYQRDGGDLWKYYVKYVQMYWKEINGGGSTTVTTETPNKVTDVKIPEYIKVGSVYCLVTGIASKAFNSKSNLTRVSIPNTITWGDLSACFSGSSKLQAINVAKDNTYVSSNSGKLIYNGTTITPAGYNSSSAQNVASGYTSKTASDSSSSAIGDKDYVELIAAFRLNSGSKIAVDTNKKTMKNISASTTISSLKQQFADPSNLVIKDSSGNQVADTALLGTGFTVSDIDRTGATITVTAMIKADVDGDGQVTSNDYVQLKATFKSLISLNGVYKEAADVNSDGKFTVSDYIMIKRQTTGTINLYG